MLTPRAGDRAQDGGAAEATHRLNRLLAEFRLVGGFGGREGLRLWGEVQRAVREIDHLRQSADGLSQTMAAV